MTAVGDTYTVSLAPLGTPLPQSQAEPLPDAFTATGTIEATPFDQSMGCYAETRNPIDLIWLGRGPMSVKAGAEYVMVLDRASHRIVVPCAGFDSPGAMWMFPASPDGVWAYRYIQDPERKADEA